MKTFLKNKITLILLLLMTITNNATGADWLNKFNNSITSTVSQPGVYNTQAGTYFSGGGYSFTAPQTSIKLINARAPSVSAGCSGINIDFGGMDFIKGEKLIKFAQGVIGAAPGYAFNLAMQTLCPQCTDLMNTLTDAANMLNGLDLDSCQTAQALVNNGFDAIGLTATNKVVGEGKSTFNKGLQDATQNIQSAISSFKSMIDGKCTDDCPKEFMKGESSFMETVFIKSKELQILSGNTSNTPKKNSGLLNIMTAFLGDIKITMKKDKSNEDELPQLKIIPAIFAGNDKEKIKSVINKWITGSETITIDSLTYESLKTIQSHVDIETLYKKEAVETFGYISVLNLESIEEAYNSRRSLTQNELIFLSRFSSPVYKILNTSSIDTNLLNSFIKNFAVLAASQLAYETLSRINREILTQLVILEAEIASFKTVNTDNNYKDGIKTIRNNIRMLNEYTYLLYEDAYAKFDKTMQDVNSEEKLRKKQQAMFARHPILSNKFFAQGAVR